MKREAEQEGTGWKAWAVRSRTGPQGGKKPKAVPGTSVFSSCTKKRHGQIHVTPCKAKNFGTLREDKKRPSEVQ